MRAPVIDGFTAEQRIFMGLAQARRGKARDAALIAQVKSDPHSPSEFRVNGSLRNHPGFYDAFDVKPGDRMYLGRRTASSSGKRAFQWRRAVAAACRSGRSGRNARSADAVSYSASTRMNLPSRMVNTWTHGLS